MTTFLLLKASAGTDLVGEEGDGGGGGLAALGGSLLAAIVHRLLLGQQAVLRGALRGVRGLLDVDYLVGGQDALQHQLGLLGCLLVPGKRRRKEELSGRVINRAYATGLEWSRDYYRKRQET